VLFVSFFINFKNDRVISNLLFINCFNHIIKLSYFNGCSQVKDSSLEFSFFFL